MDAEFKQRKGLWDSWDSHMSSFRAKCWRCYFVAKGRERSVGMVYLALFSEVFFKDGTGLF